MAQQTEIILRVGPIISQVTRKNFTNVKYESLHGFTAGAFARHSLNDHTSLSGGLQYEQNGYILRDLTFADQVGNNPEKGDIYTKMNYIVLPLMAEYGFGSTVKFSVKAGPFFGYLLSKNLIIKWVEDKPDQESKGVIDTRFNFGVGAGAAVAFPINKTIDLEINLEDHLGLYDISDGGKQNTNAINLTVGIVYRLK